MENILKENENDRSVLLKIDSPNTRYDLVHLEKINKFPFFLIANIIAKYDVDNNDKYINGVGILIGPNIILTVAHNLVCELNGRIYYPTKVYLNIAANCDLQLLESLKSKSTYVPPDYIDALRTNNYKRQLMNDWGLIFLQKNAGDYIIKLLDLESLPEIKKENSPYFYDYFIHNRKKVSSLKYDNKISILGYTVWRSKGGDINEYKFKDHFVNMKISDRNIIETLNLKMNLAEFAKDSFIEDKITNIDIDIEHKIGVDYVIFNNSSYKRHFSELDKDKLIMSESKGELDETNDNSISIKYQISTYKGQSGSPIFLRTPVSIRNSLNESDDDVYIYQLIGLHSRSDRYFFSSDNSTNQSQKCCYYKMALRLSGEIVSVIEDIAKASEQTNSFNYITTENKHDFIHVKLILNEEVKFFGLFKKEIPIWLLFNFAADVLNISKEYVLIKEIHPNNTVIQNYNYDSTKTLKSVLIDNNAFVVSFEILLNIKLYGEVLASRVILKFLETYDIEEVDLKKKDMNNKLIKKLFSNVFSEICQFSMIRPIYGRLFTKIKHLILKKLEIEDDLKECIF